MTFNTCDCCGKAIVGKRNSILGAIQFKKYHKWWFQCENDYTLDNIDQKEFDLCEDCARDIYEFIKKHPTDSKLMNDCCVRN